MGRISIIKEFTWSMAHMLSDHRGLCANLHGHTYKMQVQVSRINNGLNKDTLHSDGMVMDFSELNSIVKEKIVDPVDHAFMYWCNSNDPVEHKIADLLAIGNKKVVTVEYRPTAEEIASSFFKAISDELDKYGIVVDSVRIWENLSSCAEVNGGK